MKFTKYILFILCTLIISAVLTNFGPWWLMVVAPLILGFIFKMDGITAFSVGAISLVVFWGILIVYHLNTTGWTITDKMALLLHLKGSGVLLVIVSLFLAGLLGGLASLNGFFWRKAMNLN
ncbi:MAG: hypothetical protein J5I59_12210 [Saprospiraceae bacterium]|nr:hypothetical protein [Saprospiraceae bacterium]